MTLPVTIPNTFANATTSIPLANLDANFVTIYDAVNGIGNGAESLANVSITGGNVNVTTVTVAAGSNSAPSITTAGDTNTGIFFPAADTIAFAEGGAEAMRIDSSGNVGIGTSSPTRKLHINSGTTDTAVLIESADAVSIINMKDSTSTGDGVSFGVNGDAFIVNSGLSTERMRIDSSGNVGIGTTSPTGLLTIYNNAGGATTNLDIAYMANTQDGAVRFMRDSQEKAAIKAVNDNTFARKAIAFFTNNAGDYTTTPGTERMRITSAGEVLIGGTSAVPIGGATNGIFQINGIRQSLARWVNSSSGPVFSFGKSRSATPGSYTIVQSGDTLGLIEFAGDDGTDLQTTAAYIASYVDGTPGANDMPGRLVFATTADGAASPTERMRIDSSGNVLVGTSTSSTFKLDVSAATDVAQFIATDAGASGSQIQLFHDSASPANDDVTSLINFAGRDSAAQAVIFSRISGISTNVTNGSESGAIAFSTRNTGTFAERMRITSTGEVLVGGTTAITTDRPAMTLTAVNGPYINLYRNDTSIVAGNGLGTIGFYGDDTTSNTPTLLAYVQGVASGTHAAGDNPTDLLFGCTNDGSETVAEFARLAQDGTSGRRFQVTQPTLVNLQAAYLQAGAGTAGTVDRYGGVGAYKHSGITNSAGYLFVDAEDAARNFLWADNSDVLRISTTSSNIGTTGGTVVGTQTSDERIKNIIGPVTYGLEQIKSINPVEFTLKDDAEQTKRIGFIAQQVQPIVPESVYDTKEVIVEGEPTKLGMEYVSLIPVLVNAVKELSAEVEALKAQLKGN